MTSYGYPCDMCKRKYKGWLDPGHRGHCEAFPEGIPVDLYLYSKKIDLKECANGIGYKEDPEKAKLFDFVKE